MTVGPPVKSAFGGATRASGGSQNGQLTVGFPLSKWQLGRPMKNGEKWAPNAQLTLGAPLPRGPSGSPIVARIVWGHPGPVDSGPPTVKLRNMARAIANFQFGVPGGDYGGEQPHTPEDPQGVGGFRIPVITVSQTVRHNFLVRGNTLHPPRYSAALVFDSSASYCKSDIDS